jgi:hypothetical protein
MVMWVTSPGTKRGVRHGDPLSTILFVFSVESLDAILEAAKAAGHISSVVPHLIPGCVLYLQYADDMIVMTQPEEMGIANLKFLLLCFELMPGLCINFHKSGVMVLGTSAETQHRVANMLNCKLGTFPFTYLGLPISDQALVASY